VKDKVIYCTDGEWVALIRDGYLYDTLGEWVGWIEGQDVYTRDGEYAGFLSDEAQGTCARILRERIRKHRPLRPAPPAPPKIRPPASVPLAPMFAELPWKLVDVFEEDPYIFKHISDLKPDWEG
jgi:hypothetical protein